MSVLNRILIVLGLAGALSSTASAFFLNWGTAAPETSPVYPPYYYHQRVLQEPLPAVPVQVPLQAQLAPAAVHNVQLVPCLCPVSQDYDNFDKGPQDYFATQHKTN